jgi:hypothetical protein
MRGRGKRAGECGAESLEFLGLLPLLILFLLVAWQGLILLRQSSQAELDAQTLARSAAICGDGSKATTLWQADPGASAGSTAVTTTSAHLVKVHVTLQPDLPFKDFNLQAIGVPAPSATVVMLVEPCK